MTPEEQKLVSELFDRLATLENASRDPDALRLMQDGLRKAPNALYPLVQTVLVQDEALKQANAHIQQLEQELGYGQEPQRPPGGFLDNMRSALFGKSEPAAPPSPSPSRWGSVPSVRPGGPQGYQQEQPGWGGGAMGGPPMAGGPMGGQYPGQMPMGGGFGGGGFGGGGSFLGTAAASAAGVIGGALMMDSIRSMMGHHSGSAGSATGGPGGSGSAHAAASPWNSDASGSGGSGSGSGDLSRDAGVNDIGRGGGAGGGGGTDGGRSASLFGGNDDPQSDSNEQSDSNDAQYDVAEGDSDFDDGGFDGDDGGDDNA